jgi:acid phosphatase family membrane protein YuiD
MLGRPRIAITRAHCHPETRAYLQRKRSEGKTTREAIRCLKRHLARSAALMVGTGSSLSAVAAVAATAATSDAVHAGAHADAFLLSIFFIAIASVLVEARKLGRADGRI